MKPVVVDASAVAEYLLRTERAGPIEAVLRDPAHDLSVPALCDVEVASVLRRAILSGAMGPERAGQATEDYRDLPLTRHGHLALMERILELRDDFSPYDAAYVALAERLGATLLTGDRALGRAVDRHLALEVMTA